MLCSVVLTSIYLAAASILPVICGIDSDHSLAGWVVDLCAVFGRDWAIANDGDPQGAVRDGSTMQGALLSRPAEALIFALRDQASCLIQVLSVCFAGEAVSAAF